MASPQTAGGGGARGRATGDQPAHDVSAGGSSVQGAAYRPAHDALVQLERLPLRPREHQAVGGEEQAHAHRPRRLVQQHAGRLAHVLVRRHPDVAREAARLANRCFLQFVLRMTFRDDDVRVMMKRMPTAPPPKALADNRRAVGFVTKSQNLRLHNCMIVHIFIRDIIIQ